MATDRWLALRAFSNDCNCIPTNLGMSFSEANILLSVWEVTKAIIKPATKNTNAAAHQSANGFSNKALINKQPIDMMRKMNNGGRKSITPKRI